ncbi:15289_t:CDS:10 [Funneliformis geosporum]|uniref:RNA helicase n=1 Tax=Funneliformis geosporum TaxID=1117311 RepID=A0A9W4WXP1_9GLOM|nr:4490_t:CDS:10 [Funneliformis geosporum]CAI2183061.1 15289_t:CDS:10 [Funneliformis geosporum]
MDNGATDVVNSLADQISTLATQEPKHNALQESAHDVVVTRVDDDPILSVSTFEDLKLNENLLKGIYDMGFSKPSKIQAKALPLLLKTPPQNMIGQSQSGTGKTAAFVLTMLSRIDYDLKSLQALCLAPSRELARQIMVEVLKMAKYTKVMTAEAIRESNIKSHTTGKSRIEEFAEAQLVVGTPGTVYDLFRKRIINKNTVKIFVLDEADNMLDQQALGDQSIKIKNMMPKDCQIVLFSATYSKDVRSFAERFAPNANQFSLKIEELSVKTINQFYMDCQNEQHKFQVLDDLYTLLTIGQSIIFVQKRDTADIIARRMTEKGHKVINLHGGLSADERDHVMDGFRRGDAKVLITTNVLSRGIDVLQVNLVINYDLPTDSRGKPDFETYLHRIGRTGRFGRTGVSINFVHDANSWEVIKSIEEHFQREIIKRSLNTTVTNNVYSTSSQYQEHSQHRVSPDPSMGPKDENPFGTGPTREKPHTEGHTVNKAKEAPFSDSLQKDSPKTVVGKFKDALNHFVSPGAADVQAENAAKGLREHNQSSNETKETISSVKETVDNFQEKAKESYENAKETAKKAIQSTKDMLQNTAKDYQEKGRETLQSAQKKGEGFKESGSAAAQETMKSFQEKGQDIKEKSQETMKSAQEKGEKFKGQSQDVFKKAQETGQGTMKNLQDQAKSGVNKLNMKKDDTKENICQESEKREANEELANVKPLDRHPSGPVKEVKELAQDIKKGVKEI